MIPDSCPNLIAERHSTRNSDGYASNSDDVHFRTSL
jgi:hypothetical protein